MCIDIAMATTSAEVLEHQVRFIKYQEDADFPNKVLSVRCPCLKKLRIKYAFRCLYCSVFFCKECAEDHFGQTVAQYREENP